MAIRTYKVTLDSKNTIAPEPVYLRQGDKTGAVVIDATLMDNGEPVSIDSLTPMFKANTADGQAVITDSTGFNIVNASGGEFTYQVPSQLGSVPGKIKIAYFSFTDSSGNQSTFDIAFIIKKAADMTQESAKDWVSNLKEIIDKYNQWVNNAHTSWADFVDSNKKIIESIDPGGTLLAEIIDARKSASGKSYQTLGERLDNAVMTDIGRLNNINIVKDYNYIGESKDINEFKESIDSDAGFKILYVTDVHYGEGTNDSGTASIDKYRDYVKAPPLSKLMLKNLAAFDMAVNISVWNGDLIHGHEGKDINKIHNVSISGMIRGVIPNTDAFIGIGNHEDGTVWNYQEAINRKELLSEYGYDNNGFGETRNGFAAYKDYDDSKIRIVHIAGYDNPEIYNSDGSVKYPRGSHSVFSQDQLNFILACLNSVPDGYTVLMFNHGPLLGFFGNTPYSSTYNVNHDLLNGMLSAFAKHESYSGTGTNTDYPASINCDFSESTAILAGIITGHEHRDRSVQEVNGVKSVMRTCFLAADRGGDGVETSTTDDDLGTKQQYAFDIIEVDTANRKVSFKRFGKGGNYEYEY